ncbi:MAG: LCP family protein [Actinomycetota bacterium]|nr:LCP family protein [Actinomycetota bacterium]
MSRHGADDPYQDQDPDFLDGSEDGASLYDADESDPEYRESRSNRRRRRAGKPAKAERKGWQKALIVVLVSGLVLGLAAVGVFFFFTQRYLGNIEQIANPFVGIDEETRPPPPDAKSGEDPVTFLLVGSDSRDPDAEGPPGDRADVIMIMRISGPRNQVQFISIPRDSWVPIPGRGLNKINAAYAFGGPTLLIQTVEQLTGVRIDHFAAVDFFGFKEITDALGGVDVRVAETTSQGGVTFEQGLNHLNGAEALIYVRQRKGLPGGDLDRVQRQQNYLRAVMGTVFQQNMLGDLGKTDDLLLALTNAISVDETLTQADMLGLAFSLRNLNQNSLSFLTVPVAGLGREGAASVVYIDTAQAAPMWSYLQDDTLADHLAEFGEDLLPEVPY